MFCVKLIPVFLTLLDVALYAQSIISAMPLGSTFSGGDFFVVRRRLPL
jgi:hypothetical protein